MSFFKKKIAAIAGATLVIACVHAVSAADTFDMRKARLVNAVAAMQIPADLTYIRYADAALQKAAALFEKGSAAEANTLVTSAMDHSNGSAMFYYYYLLYDYLKYNGQMTTALKDRIKTTFTSYGGGVTGATENHGIMYATAFYLAKETWPTATFAHPSFGTGDPDGKQKLIDWMQYAVKKGYLESDCFYYDVFYQNCMAMISEFSPDPLMSLKAKMTLDWMLLNGAGQWLKGLRVATYQRGSNDIRNFESPYAPGMTTIGYWLYFGGADTMNLPLDNVYSYSPLGKAILNAVCTYRMPSIIEKIATDRTTPFLHKETHVKDGGALGSARAWYRSSYMTSQYGLAGEKDLAGNSFAGFAGSLIRWQVKWVSDSAMSTFYINQPTGSYAGTSYYEEVFHQKKALIGVAKIPSTIANPYLLSYNSKKAIQTTIEKSDGWVLMHCGTVLIATKFAKGYYWNPEDSVFRYMRSDSLKNAYAVETALPSAYPGATNQAQLDAFYNALVQKTQFTFSLVNDSMPCLRYVSLDGDTMKLTYSADRYGNYQLNGQKFDYYATWPLIENPWCFQKDNDPILRMWYGPDTLQYDFNNWTIAASGVKKVDMVAYSLTTTPQQIALGTPVTVAAYIRNAGTAALAATSQSVAFQVQQADNSWLKVASVSINHSFAVGESLLVTATSTFTLPANGTFAVRAMVDENNVIAEANDANNFAYGSVTVARVNLALGKTITNDGAAVAALTDGNVWSTWTSVAVPETLVLDLGSLVSVDQIIIKEPTNWATGRNMTFSLEGSASTTGYATLAASKSYAFAGNVMTASVTFTAAKVRYIRMIVTAYAVGGTAQTVIVMSEIEAYGPADPTGTHQFVVAHQMRSLPIKMGTSIFWLPLANIDQPVRFSLYSIQGRCIVSLVILPSELVSALPIQLSKVMAHGSYICALANARNGEILARSRITLR